MYNQMFEYNITEANEELFKILKKLEEYKQKFPQDFI